MKYKLAVILILILVVSMTAACRVKAGDDTDTRKEEKSSQDKPDAKPRNSTGKGEEDISREDSLEESVGEYMERMTVEEKAAQLFIILPEALMKDAGTVTATGETTRKAVGQIPVGGFIYQIGRASCRERV